MAAESDKVKVEDLYRPSDKELDIVGDLYKKYYLWRSRRSGDYLQFQGYTFEEYLTAARELFWNAVNAPSEDLAELGINVAIPYIRKEILDFMGRMTSLGIKPRLVGNNLNNFGVRMLNGIYDKWRFKSNQKVEKFWQLLYGKVNGTMIAYVGYKRDSFKADFVREYNFETGDYRIETKKMTRWDDVWEELRPLEDIYVPKIEEKDMQLQYKLIDRKQMPFSEFQNEYRNNPRAKFVYPGTRLSGNSLYFQLLASSGITTLDRVEKLVLWDTIKDQKIEVANGIWLNPLKGDKPMPNPFSHKMLPYIKAINKPIDEKFFYGLSDSFDMKDPAKIANTMNSLMIEQEIRETSPPYLSSDIESPQILFGGNDVIPVNDVDAYKKLDTSPVSASAFSLKQGMEGVISATIQGGPSQMPNSIQPRSAKEVAQVMEIQQKSMANAMLMYYDLLRQEILLVNKTAMQFYASEKYRYEKGNILKSLIVPDSPLLNGGVGNLEIRVVRENTTAMQLYMESLQKSFENQKQTEIIEAPVDLIQNLEFEVNDVELEPEHNTMTEQALFMEKMQWFTPFVQMGIVSPTKLFLRGMEKLNEHPADYVDDKMLPQMLAQWNQGYNFDPKTFVFPGQNMPAQSGNVMQMDRGSQGGMQGGAGNGGPSPFGSQTAPGLKQLMTA